MTKTISRECFKELLTTRHLVWAGLYEKQDYAVPFPGNTLRVVRDLTGDPACAYRKKIGT